MNLSEGDTTESRDNDELYVCPWMGILANVPVHLVHGRPVGSSGSTLKDILKREGFDPVKVTPLWGKEGHSRFAIIEFNPLWFGLVDALKFEKAYEVRHQGKRDYLRDGKYIGKLYGWMARKDDHDTNNIVGSYLKKNGDLKTIKQCETEEEIKHTKLVSQLNTRLDILKRDLIVMENKCNLISHVMNEMENMNRAFSEDEKHALELDIKHLTGSLQAAKHLGDDGGKDMSEEFRIIQQEIEEKAKKLQDPIFKERKCNEEVQKAREELINGMKDLSDQAIIVLKMGELSSTAFLPAAKRMCLGSKAESKAVELCTRWKSRIMDSNWHPLKFIQTEGGESLKIINEEDEELTKLRNELGEEAYQAVATALLEMTEKSPSGRYVTERLWNTKENRIATLKEGVECIMKEWRNARKHEMLETGSFTSQH